MLGLWEAMKIVMAGLEGGKVTIEMLLQAMGEAGIADDEVQNAIEILSKYLTNAR